MHISIAWPPGLHGLISAVASANILKEHQHHQSMPIACVVARHWLSLKGFIMCILHLLMISLLSIQSDADESGLPEPKGWQMSSSCGANVLYHFLAINGINEDFGILLSELAPPREGNSLQELIVSAQKHGVRLQAYKCDESGLDRIALPFIACTEVYDMRHYILVTGKADGKFIVWDDKAFTARSISRSTFLRMWTGYALSTGITPWYDSRPVLLVAISVEILLIVGMLDRSIRIKGFSV